MISIFGAFFRATIYSLTLVLLSRVLNFAIFWIDQVFPAPNDQFYEFLKIGISAIGNFGALFWFFMYSFEEIWLNAITIKTKLKEAKNAEKRAT